MFKIPSEEQVDLDVAATIRRIIFGIAADEEAAAAAEAARVPYWKSCPDSVIGHRAAAHALRAVAESIPFPFSFPVSGTQS